MNKQMPVNNEPLDARSAFAADIFEGLSKHQKSIPCQYFYDEIGSGLFEQITDLDEYYPTRTEISILNACVAVIAGQTAHATALIEFGSGSSLKTDILLAACPAIKHYVPIDVSLTMLASAKLRLATRFPRLVVEPVMGDFTAKVTLPADVGALPKLGFFPGSTIGNFSHDAAVGLFSHFRDLLGRGARLIVGADLRKAPGVLVSAYNDAKGVTAAFNLNLLTRINRELDGTFDLTQFEHLATYDERAGRIDMWLVSKKDQYAVVSGHRFRFATGERIHTEISQKYDIGEFQDLAKRAGWHPANVWTDPKHYFSVHELTTGA